MSIAALIPVVGKLLDRVIPDKSARAAAEESLKVLEQSGDLQLLLGQMEVNKVEAAHKSIFVAGGRPFIVWICGLGLLYNVILSPFLSIWLEVPVVDPALLYPVLLGILGLGGMRSFEKVKGVAREK